MRVLFTCCGLSSHMFPLVPLGWALRAAGHDVHIASQPALAGQLERTGLTSVAVGRDIDMVDLFLRDREEADPQEPPANAMAVQHSGDVAGMNGAIGKAMLAARRFATVAEAMSDDLVAYGQAWQPDLVVHEPTAFAGGIVAAALGRPAVRHLWGVDLTFGLPALAAPALAPLLARHGITSGLPQPALIVDPCPPTLRFALSPSGQQMSFVPYNGTGAMPYWLLVRAKRPRVCLTVGTNVAPHGGVDVMRTVLDALGGLDVEVVVAVLAEHRSALGELPHGVRVVESLPLHLLVQTCDVAIHHAGPGTTLTCLWGGLPSLAIPHIADQFLNADQLEKSGAGAQMFVEDLTVEGIRKRVDELLTTPSYGEAARRLREEMRAQPTPAQVVPVLERLAAR